MRVAAITHGSRTNGPGRRSVLHLQGCHVGCGGCFAKHLWDPAGGTEMDVAEVARQLLVWLPDGVACSGGEPLEQASELLALLRLLRDARPFAAFKPRAVLPMGVVLYSGLTARQRDCVPEWPEIWSLVDAAVLGPFAAQRALSPVVGLRSSSNQELVVRPGGRLTLEELMGRAPQIEVQFGTEAVVMGFPTESALAALKEIG